MKLSTKKLIFAFFLVLTILNLNAQIVWNGAGTTNNFSEGANWVGGVSPVSGDDAVFDGTSSKNCDFDIDVDVDNLTIGPGYTGVVDALSSNPAIAANFVLASGTFNSTNNTLLLAGDFTMSGGTFNHNSGIVEFSLFGGVTVNISGTITFNELVISSVTFPSSSVLRTVNFGTGVTTDILTLNGGSRLYAYQGNVTVNSQFNILGSNSGNPGGTNTGTFTLGGGGPVSIVGASAAGRNKLANITVNTTGAVSLSNHINLEKSWTSTNIGSFTPGTSTANFYTASSAITGGTTATTRAYFDNVTLQTGATLNVTTGSHIDFNGNFTDNGTFTGNTSLLRFTNNASGAQSVGGSSALTTINAIEKTGNGSLSFGHAVNLLDSIRISGGAVTGTNLRLKSTASLKGRIAEISGGGSLGGSITVETFIPGGTTDWQNLGASGVSGLTFNSWYGQIPMAIQGSTTGVTSAGGMYFESVWRWDETGVVSAIGYDSTVAVTDPINVGQGYWLFVGTGLSITSAITTTVTGTAVTGTQNLPLTSSSQAGNCLLANPFASPISWDKIEAANSGKTLGAIHIYNRNGGGLGDYSGGVGTNGVNSTIPAGQGFYVEATGAGNLTINESHKVSNNTGANPLLKTTSSSIGSVIRLQIQDVYGYKDESAIRFHSSGTTAFDNNLDANKYFDSPGYIGYPGTYSQRTSICTQSLGKNYSINSLPYATTANAVIPVLAKVYASGQHTITGIDLANLAPGTCVTLKDKLLNVTHNLLTGPYVCNINDTTSTARFELTVCANITAGVNNLSAAPENVFVKQDRNGVYVDLNFESNTKAIITANNILGQQLMAPKQVECVSGKYYLDLTAKEQIIMVSVIANNKRTTKKIFVENNN